jgi:hypothetical protein
MFTNFEELQKLGRDNMDSAMQSFGALTKGVQAIAVELADHSKQAFEASTAAAERLMGAKSLDTAFELQSDYAKTAYEAFVARAGKISQLVTETARDSYKPYEAVYAKAASFAK